VQSQASGSGGSVCAPIAHDIYEAIVKKTLPAAPPTVIGTALLGTGKPSSGSRPKR